MPRPNGREQGLSDPQNLKNGTSFWGDNEQRIRVFHQKTTLLNLKMPNLEKEEHLQTQSHQFLVDSKILVFRGCKFFVGSLNQLKKG